MDAFNDKGQSEVRTYTASYSKFVADSLSISSFSVAIAVHEDSEVADPDPGSMLNGSAQLNATDYTTPDGIRIPANCGVLQSIQGGIVGALYVVTFEAVMSDGQNPYEQATLYIAEYVPDE